MKKRFPLKIALAGTLLMQAVLTAGPAVYASASSQYAAAGSTDKTTKYRVYQNNVLLYEVADLNRAQALAKGFANSHVEEIGTRKWLWDNFPRYRVYQDDISLPEWQFATLEQAIAEAQKWSHASIRDLQSRGGWVWNNYPRYRLYQGEVTLPTWEFTTLTAATTEAKKWGNAHIIDLTTNDWIWDNIPSDQKQEMRSGSVQYRVFQGTTTLDNWSFASLEDAVREALHWANSSVVNVHTNQTVYENRKPYEVYQNDHFLEAFISLDAAADYARLYAHTRIMFNGKAIWNQYPYYEVLQNGNLIGEATNIPEAVQFAMGYADSSIRTLDKSILWDNVRKLQFWGWNGMAGMDAIRSQVLGTSGLDVDSPTFFQLADASGNLKDASDKSTVDWLKKQGFDVYPLVNNQFDSDLTTKFLADVNAQAKFINSLVERTIAIGAGGVNLDFETMKGTDRNEFTSFVKNLTDTFHAKGLAVSIDLPRGSVKWNSLTAYDHEKLGDIVDYVVIMAYDQYYRGSTSPGSVSGLQWTEEGIQEFLSYGIHRDKIILGIPYYVREWKLDATGALVSNRTVLLKDVPSLIASTGATQTWDPTFNQYKVEYAKDGFHYEFWLENDDTVKARLNLAKKYDLSGIAAWRLGYDNPQLWNAILPLK